MPAPASAWMYGSCGSNTCTSLNATVTPSPTGAVGYGVSVTGDSWARRRPGGSVAAFTETVTATVECAGTVTGDGVSVSHGMSLMHDVSSPDGDTTTVLLVW